MRTSLLILLALVCIPVAAAAGPWLGTASNGVAGYTADIHGATTSVGDGAQHTLSLHGRWGLPRVTLDDGVGGLSADGRTLVLSQDFDATGALRSRSSFLVLGTKPLRVKHAVRLDGDFGFDALSPHGRTLYLIQHVSAEDLFQYRVRAYDLRTGTLLERVVADKRQRDCSNEAPCESCCCTHLVSPFDFFWFNVRQNNSKYSFCSHSLTSS